jgi:chromosome segregation ATPase
MDGLINVEDVLSVDHDERDFRPAPPEGASYELGNTKLQNKTFWTSLRSDIRSYLAAHRNIEIWKCPGLKLYSRVDEKPEDFKARCEQAADDAADFKVSRLRDKYAKRIDRLQDQISSADVRVTELQVDVSTRTQTEVMSGVGDLLGGLLKGRVGSRTLSRAASRRAASKKAQARLATARQKADAKRRDLVELEGELQDELISIQSEYDALAASIETLEIGLEKNDIRVAEARLVWVPVDPMPDEQAR